MGAPFWSNQENSYFVHKILPRSQYSSGSFDGENGETFDDLAPVMQAAMDAVGGSRRRYTGYMLFQHWYQKLSPRSYQRGEAHEESAFPAHPVERNGEGQAGSVAAAGNRRFVIAPATPRFPESAIRSTLTRRSMFLDGTDMRLSAPSSGQATAGSSSAGSHEKHPARLAPPRNATAILAALAQGAKKRRDMEEDEEVSTSDDEYRGKQKRIRGTARFSNNFSQARASSANGRQEISQYGTLVPALDRGGSTSGLPRTQLLTSNYTPTPMSGFYSPPRDDQATASQERIGLDILADVAANMAPLPTTGTEALTGTASAPVSQPNDVCPDCGQDCDNIE